MKKTLLTVTAVLAMTAGNLFAQDFTVNNNLYLPGTAKATSMESINFLFHTEGTGVVKKFPVPQVIGMMLDQMYSTSCEGGGGPIPNPVWNNGTNKLFTSCSDVKVGIGTSSPTHQLTVTGNSKFSGHTWLDMSLSIGADQSNFGKLYIENANRNAALYINATGNTHAYNKLLFLEFDNESTEIIKVLDTRLNYSPFTLKTNGEMTIHNGTKKIMQLEADGLIRLRKIRVDTEVWADYVFEDDYKLMEISELKRYIAQNKHLPNVPSEKEVLQNGIDLAEMNKILLQKIEELTLYLLQQQHQIDELNRKL